MFAFNVMRKICLPALFCLPLVVILSAGCSPASFAPEAQPNAWMSSFESPFLQMAPQPKPNWSRNLGRWLYESQVFSSDVAAETNDIPVGCRFRNYAASKSGENMTDITREYLNDCEDAISTGPKDLLRNAYRTLFVRFPIKSHPYIRRVIMNLPNGYRLPGLLALKDDQYKRPWVIVRAGIFGSGLELKAERFLLIQLFEQAHFNVLFLDSSTSEDTIALNQHLVIGGLDEGIQNYQVGQKLLDPAEPLSRLVSEIHLLAISMGGHSIFMSMILNESNPKVFQSAVGLCPLVQFAKTFKEHEGNPGFITGVNLYASYRMGELLQRIPNLSRFRFLPQAFDWVRSQFRAPLTLTPDLKFPPGFPVNDFDKGNDLVPWMKLIKQPVSILASRQDKIVPYAMNTGVLEKQIAELPFLHIYPLTETFHCTLPGAYAWTEMSELLRAQFRTALSAPDSTQELPMGFHHVFWPIPNLNEGEKVAEGIQFELQEGDEFLLAKLRTVSKAELLVQIPVDALGWGTSQKIRTETEARVLLRWAQVNVRVSLAEDGKIYLTWGVPPGFKLKDPAILIQ